ncbi:MAG: DUF4038 domain-containing protein [Hyphomonadaceae bacterium]|nr:DUF4038 domain-containing protein [Hyphomonadaceae bacterium]
MRFPLHRVNGRRYLADDAGRPFFLHGDVGWSMVAELRREDADIYLKDRAGRGVTGVLVKLLEAYHASNAPRNAYGDGPFVGGRVDFRTPNDAYFAHFDWIVRRAEELGMLVLAAPAYLGAEGRYAGFYQEMVAAGAARLRAYGQYLGRRYAQTQNLLWVMGGDYNPPEKDLVRAVAEGIREGGSKGLMTAHTRAFTSAWEVWQGESWLNVNTVYTYGDVAAAARAEYARPDAMPFFLFESYYENERAYPDIPVVNNAPRHRQQAYEAILGGAFGHMFGSRPVWHFSGPGSQDYRAPDWRAGLDSPGARSMMRVREFFRPLEWWRLAPDLEGQFLRTPKQAPEAPTAAVADDKSFGVAYAPRGGGLSINPAFAGPGASAAWVDPVDGRRVAIATGEGGAGGQVAPPGRNAGDDPDWLLLVRQSA